MGTRARAHTPTHHPSDCVFLILPAVFCPRAVHIQHVRPGLPWPLAGGPPARARRPCAPGKHPGKHPGLLGADARNDDGCTAPLCFLLCYLADDAPAPTVPHAEPSTMDTAAEAPTGEPAAEASDAAAMDQS